MMLFDSEYAIYAEYLKSAIKLFKADKKDGAFEMYMRNYLAPYDQPMQINRSLVDLSRDVDKAGGAMLAPDKSLIDRLDRYKDFEVQLTENISEIFNYVHAEYSRYSYVAYQKLHDILPQFTLCSETQEDIVRAFAHILS